MLNCTFLKKESKVLQCTICIWILLDPDPNPNPNGLIGFGFEFGSIKTFGSFRIRIPNTVFNNGAQNLRALALMKSTVSNLFSAPLMQAQEDSVRHECKCTRISCAISASAGGLCAPLVQAQEDSVRH